MEYDKLYDELDSSSYNLSRCPFCGKELKWDRINHSSCLYCENGDFISEYSTPSWCLYEVLCSYKGV